MFVADLVRFKKEGEYVVSCVIEDDHLKLRVKHFLFNHTQTSGGHTNIPDKGIIWLANGLHESVLLLLKINGISNPFRVRPAEKARGNGYGYEYVSPTANNADDVLYAVMPAAGNPSCGHGTEAHSGSTGDDSGYLDVSAIQVKDRVAALPYSSVGDSALSYAGSTDVASSHSGGQTTAQHKPERPRSQVCLAPRED